MKTKKLLLKASSIILLTSFLGCASLPPPPQGDLCVISVADGGAVCVPINPAVVKEYTEAKHLHCVNVPNKNALMCDKNSFEAIKVEFKAMDNWIAFDPQTWANLQAYINKLKYRAKQCQAAEDSLGETYAPDQKLKQISDSQ